MLGQNELHFLKFVTSFFTLLGFEDEVAGWFYAENAGEECAVTVFVGVESVLAVEVLHVEGSDVGVVPLGRFIVKGGEAFGYFVQYGLCVVVLACDVFERYGVWCVAPEQGLVDVYSATDDAVADGFSFQVTLDQCAADFAVVPVDVVRPFNGYSIGADREGLRYGDGNALGEDELVCGWDGCGVTQQGEYDVHAWLRLP